jgi:hypothetical protein
VSTLADFFIASEDLAPSYAGDEQAWPAGEVVSATSLNVLHFEILQAIFEGKEWEDGAFEEFKEVGEADEDGPWTHRFPNSFTEKLAAATPEELEKAGAEWAETEEMSGDSDGIVPLLEQLQTLAQKAQASGRGLFLWSSL